MCRCTSNDIEEVVRVAWPYRGTDDPWLVFAYVLQDKDTYVLMPDDNSLYLFRKTATGEYDSHMIGSLKTLKMAVDWMFKNTDCSVLTATPPSELVDRWGKRNIKKFGGERKDGKYILRRTLCHQ